MVVERYSRRYVEYEGRLYRSATFELVAETNLGRIRLVTWDWAEDWDYTCGEGWEGGYCPALEDLITDYAEGLLDEVAVTLTFTLRCPYTATKPTNKDVTTLGEADVEISLNDLFGGMLSVEIRSLTVEVRGGRSGGHYPDYDVTWDPSREFLRELHAAAVRFVSNLPETIIAEIKDRLIELAAEKDPKLPEAVEKAESCYADLATVDVDYELRTPPTEPRVVDVRFAGCEH